MCIRDRDNYGPVWIPEKGATITLNKDNLPIYERCIVAYAVSYTHLDVYKRQLYDRVVNERDYLWPIPQDEIDKNPNLRPNNPGW